MIIETMEALGVWNWILLAVILFAIEILVPGSFVLWFGISALIVGLLSAGVEITDLSIAWQLQLVLFALFALLFSYIGRNYFNAQKTDDPAAGMLNRRGDQLVGQTGTLIEPIVGGSGRAKIGDTTWKVIGPDLTHGQPVKVVNAEDNILIVEAL